jgi:hypothetical protein
MLNHTSSVNILHYEKSSYNNSPPPKEDYRALNSIDKEFIPPDGYKPIPNNNRATKGDSIENNIPPSGGFKPGPVIVNQANVSFPFIYPVNGTSPSFFEPFGNCNQTVISSIPSTPKSSPLIFIPSNLQNPDFPDFSRALDSLQPLISEPELFKKENSLARIPESNKQEFHQTGETDKRRATEQSALRPVDIQTCTNKHIDEHPCLSKLRNYA